MAAAAPPRVVHTLPGRVRVHVPAWSGADAARLEAALARSRGVCSVRANGRTRNVLVRYDALRLDEAGVVRRLARALRSAGAGCATPPSHASGLTRRGAAKPRHRVLLTHSSATRARIAVPGLDRDPAIARRLVERLARRPRVRRVVPSPLTGRVLVEFEGAVQDLQGILDEISDIGAPDDERERPAHPLDPAPIIDGASRVIGAALGAALLIARRANGSTEPPVSGPGPGEVANAVVLLDGIAPIAHRLEEVLGHERKELLFAAIGIVSMTSAGGVVGLAFTGVTGLRVLTEVLARRSAWREYERRLGEAPPAYPGAIVTLDAGRRVPLRARVIDGAAIGQAIDGAPQPLVPGAWVDAGVRVYGGPVTVELDGEALDVAPVLPAATDGRSLADRYLHVVPMVAGVAGAGTLLATRSVDRALTALLIVNPRPALAGAEHADRGAAARVLRAGVTVVGSRADRPIRRPDVLMLDGARALCDGWEVRDAATTEPGLARDDVVALAGTVVVAAGSPWGTAFDASAAGMAIDGSFDGRRAVGTVGETRWIVEPVDTRAARGALAVEPGEQPLGLRREHDGSLAGVLTLRPRLAGGAAELAAVCRTLGVRLEVVSPRASDTARSVAERAGASAVIATASERVAAMRSEGLVVSVVGDGAGSAEAFATAHLAIGLSSGLSGPFPARADLLAPRLEAIAAIVDTGARHDRAVRDATVLSIAANVGGGVWAARTRPPFRAAGRPILLAALAAAIDAGIRLAGGRRERTVVERLADPLPERWGRQDPEAVLERLGTTADGLSWEEAERRWSPPLVAGEHRAFVDALTRQVASPLVGFLAGGALLSLTIGAVGDAAMIGAVLVANAMIGAWQEHHAGEATRMLQELGPPLARVMREGHEEEIPARRLVAGDVLVLVPGDRIAADARLLDTINLEVDEAALTGESLPVAKSAQNGTDASRIVLEGTDVTIGTGRAVVVAVGAGTRMGAIAAALSENGTAPSPLDDRLGRIMWRALPWIALGGALAAGPGIAFGRPAVQQLSLGASIAIAAVPEGLPLLAGVAEAGVARRLAQRNALVTRLSAVEALGRVDVACADKTGTLTSGRLTVRVVAEPGGEPVPPDALTPALREVLATAGCASPAPDDPAARAHPTDVAVTEAARAAGVAPPDRDARSAETPFDPVRSFHATRVGDRLCLKGAVEVLVPRCSRVRRGSTETPLDDRGRERLLAQATTLASEGLRVLLVADGDARTPMDDPRDLVAIGFVGIGDPLRPQSREAVARCQEAGVRVLMLTGDHAATARAVARQVGLPAGDEHLLTGSQMAGLDDDALQRRLERTTVIARSTPLDKVRIIEALRRRGHVVAMTGDGVNDAPALRLADVGVAMGRHGTEVARHAADLVLTDDDFAALTEALVEGRTFWANMRRSLGLLLGGNAGEVATIVAIGATGMGASLTTRQVLTINLISDVLPAMTVAMRPPEHRDLSGLAREGRTALDAPLRAEILRRAAGTAVPSLGACVVAAAVGGPAAVAPVAFLSVMGTQLAQTMALSRTDGRTDPAIVAASGASVAALVVGGAVPATRRFLGLSGVTPTQVGLALGASAVSPVLVRAMPNGRA